MMFAIYLSPHSGRSWHKVVFNARCYWLMQTLLNPHDHCHAAMRVGTKAGLEFPEPGFPQSFFLEIPEDRNMLKRWITKLYTDLSPNDILIKIRDSSTKPWIPEFLTCMKSWMIRVCGKNNSLCLSWLISSQWSLRVT